MTRVAAFQQRRRRMAETRVEPYTGIVWTRTASDPTTARLVAVAKTEGRRVIDEQTWASWAQPFRPVVTDEMVERALAYYNANAEWPGEAGGEA